MKLLKTSLAIACCLSMFSLLSPLSPACGQTDDTVASEVATPSNGSVSADEAHEDSPTEPQLLTIADDAPSLQLAKFVQGEALDQFETGKVYVVEFWATWCGPCRAGMPHLSELQDRYADEVVFVGVTREDEEAVDSFLARESMPESGEIWADIVTYRLALDDTNATTTAYMRAAQRSGIPCAFIVGKDSKVEWIGHPGEIDAPLAKVVSGAWDREGFAVQYALAREREERLRQARVELLALRRAEKWDKAIALFDELIAEAPDADGLKLGKMSFLCEAKRFDAAVSIAQSVAEDNWDDARVLNRIAWSMITRSKDSELCVHAVRKFAERAVELAPQDAGIVDTLARVHFEAGRLDEAIAWQQKAVKLADPNGAFEKTLKVYLGKRDQTDEASDNETSDGA